MSELPNKIRATDLGEFWSDTEDHPLDNDVLICCTDPDGSEHEAVQPDTPAMELMHEMARRYNHHPELLKVCKSVLNGIPTGCVVERQALDAAIRAAESKIR